MTRCAARVAAALFAAMLIVTSVDVRAQVKDPAHQHEASTRVEGPPVSLQNLLDEAMEKNPELASLRDQIAVVRQRPNQERGLPPPMAEAQIWQWPMNTLNPINTNMYMFMVGQDIPGRGKRDARAAVAERDIALAGADATIRARQ